MSTDMAMLSSSILCQFCFASLCLSGLALAADDADSRLSQAKAAVEANLRTREGKAFDERIGKEYVEKQAAAVKLCKQSNPLTEFWLFLKLGQGGSVQESLIDPITPIGLCVQRAVLKEKFVQPPRADYWVGIYLKLQR